MLAALASACAHDDGNKKKSTTRSKSDPAPTADGGNSSNGTAGGEHSGGAPNPEGKWLGGCFKDDVDGDAMQTYSITKASFTGGAFETDQDFFSDASCQQKLYSARMKGTFKTGASLAQPAGAYAITLTATEEYLTVHNADFVALYNGTMQDVTSTPICGGGWAVGTERKLTKEACGDDVDDTQTVYNIYKISGSKMYVGDVGDEGSSSDGSSADKLPTSFYEDTYTKQ
jgi:hypothetical protein